MKNMETETETEIKTESKTQVRTVVIDPETHRLLRDFCKSRGLKIGNAASAAIKKHIEQTP